MKKSLLILSAALALAVTSCDNREDIEGQWQSDNINLSLPNTTSSTAKMVMTFTQDGKVSINTDINVTEPMADSTDPATASQVSAAATASIDGTWQYAKGENDEVNIKFDDSTFALNVAPEAVSFSAKHTLEADSTQLEALKQAAVVYFKDKLTGPMKTFFGTFSRIEDIKVDKENSSLKFETDIQGAKDVHYTFSRI